MKKKKTPEEKAEELGYIIDKCPKCNKKMAIICNDFLGFDVKGQFCVTKRCWFYGIKRQIYINEDYN